MTKVSPQGNDDDTLAELENGPVQNRECRDILCCLLFIAALGAMFLLAGIAISQGNPYKIMAPFDSGDNQCGVTTGFGSYKKIFFVAPLYTDDNSFKRTLCVSKCPTDYQATVDCKVNTIVNTCTGTKTTQADIASAFAAGAGTTASAIMIYPTKDVFNLLCAPELEALKALMTGITAVQNALSMVQKYVNEIIQNGSILGVAIGISLVLGTFFMVFLQYCAGIFVWAMILTFHLLIAFLAYLFWNKSQNGDDLQKSENLNICYFFLGLLGTCLLFFICMYKRIRLAIGIIKTAALFTKEVKSALIIPFFQFAFFIICFVLWVIGFLFVYTIGEFKKNSIKLPFPSASHTDVQLGYQGYWLFMGLWINAFIGAVGTFVISSSACIWYFAQLNAHKPVSRSFYRAFRYHLGSLAFGSLILAIVQFIRIVLTYLQKKAKDSGADKNPLFKILMCVLQCYMACLERFIAFLNKNAYIQIALNGKSFCSAAKDALFLLLKNPARASAVGGLGSIFTILGEVFVSAGTLVLCYLIVNNLEPWKTSVTEPYLIYLLCLIIGYSVGAAFMLVFGQSATTILHCFILDEEINKTKGRDPVHTPEPLREFLDDPKK